MATILKTSCNLMTQLNIWLGKGSLTGSSRTPPRDKEHKSRSPKRKSLEKQKQIVARVVPEKHSSDEKEEAQTPPVALVISRGIQDKGARSKNSMKRSFKETMLIAFVDSFQQHLKGNRPLISFTDDDLIDNHLNYHIPLLVRAFMVTLDVQRVFIDQGSSTDITYLFIFQTLGLKESNMVPYKGSDLQ